MGPLAPFFGSRGMAEGGIAYKYDIWHNNKREGVVAQGVMQITLE